MAITRKIKESFLADDHGYESVAAGTEVELIECKLNPEFFSGIEVTVHCAETDKYYNIDAGFLVDHMEEIH